MDRPGAPLRHPAVPALTRAQVATGETGFSDVIYDLVSVQYHALKGGHDYGQYVRDARNAGYDDIAQFFEQVMEEERRAAACHDFLARLSSAEDTGTQVS